MSVTNSLLLVDDKVDKLEELASKLEVLLTGQDVIVKKWKPTDAPDVEFEKQIEQNTLLVITDYDLSTAQKGLFGTSIIGWCQNLLIPVGEFSRRNNSNLPKEPNLFELRVTASDGENAGFIVGLFNGFKELRDKIRQRAEDRTNEKPASILSEILGRPQTENQLLLYMSRIGASNSALTQRLLSKTKDPNISAVQEKVAMLSYFLGHVLINSILKYPGPILSSGSLCAYVGVNDDAYALFGGLFHSARYAGPFSAVDTYFWKEDIDEILEGLSEELPDLQAETEGEFSRKAIEKKLMLQLPLHSCQRCHGKNGGFYCPFTKRAVCSRKDCSVPANGWLPQGAQICRIEKDFYDEWAPLLGL